MTRLFDSGWQKEALGQLQITKLILRLLRPEAAVTAFSFLLPDLIDKPLWVLGVFPDGRYIGHTLLMVFLVALAFSLKKGVYGLVALCGGMAHLLSDTSALIAWFFPFKEYDFPNENYHGIVTWQNVAETLLEMAFVVIAVSVILFLIHGFFSLARKRCMSRARHVGQSTRSSDVER